jgi:hypothetical protein
MKHLQYNKWEYTLDFEQKTTVPVPTQSIINCITVNRFLSLFKLIIVHLQNEGKPSTWQAELWYALNTYLLEECHIE